MPRLWVLNSEEAAAWEDPEYEAAFLPKAIGLAPRFLFCLEPGDLAVTHCPVEAGFLRYVRAVNAWREEGELLLRPSGRSRPYSLIDSILGDAALLSRLRRLGRSGAWTLEPFLESPAVARLSARIGIPTSGSARRCLRSGKSLRFNDKARFKALARRLGIATVPGVTARGRAALARAVERLGRGGRRLVLKKALSAGGLGNRSGSARELLRGLSSWCGPGLVLVEPWLDFAQVAGTLVRLTEEGVRFGGADSQVLEDGRWVGLCYPHPDQALVRRLAASSLKLGRAFRAAGLRGELNLDWGILRDITGGTRRYALESNFRHNGFGFLLRFARRYFAQAFPRLHMLYLENVPAGPSPGGFARLRQSLRRQKLAGEPLLIERPGRGRGAVIMMPPRASRCAVALFGPNPLYLSRAKSALRAALA